jgi:hypothetical protein
MVAMWRMERLSASPHRLPEVVAMVREYVLLPDAWSHRCGPTVRAAATF